ncbi:MAG: hypothetical protein BGO43_07320 [Gammaproteobacteria bacterium 39-13]|nr:MAG: hypothetical protein BGO43_07320 [Gammaproteobacteria bacterium 39-13]
MDVPLNYDRAEVKRRRMDVLSVRIAKQRQAGLTCSLQSDMLALRQKGRRFPKPQTEFTRLHNENENTFFLQKPLSCLLMP